MILFMKLCKCREQQDGNEGGRLTNLLEGLFFSFLGRSKDVGLGGGGGGGSRSRVARLGLNLGNFISVIFFFLSFSLSICSSRTSSLVTSTFLFRSSYL